MSLNINSTQIYNQNLKKNNVVFNNQTNTTISKPQTDTVSFRGKNNTATGFIGLFAKMMLGSAAAGLGINYINQSFIEDEARKDFEKMKNMTGFWLDKYSNQPEILEKILLENEGVIKPRLFDVSQEKVMRIFSKDEDALKRIYNTIHVIQFELNKEDNKYTKSTIELLGEKYPEILDFAMFKEDEYNGFIPIFYFASNSKIAIKSLGHINKAYKNRLDVLAEMYLLKDNKQNYPLYYIKKFPLDIQDKIIEDIKYTFESRHDLLMKVIETLGSDELINKIKEEDSNKPLKFLMQTGLNKDTINQTLELMDESSRNILIDGLNNRKFLNKKDYPPIKNLYEIIYKQVSDKNLAAKLTFNTLVKIFYLARNFDSDKEISFNFVVRNIEENGISIIDKKDLKISENGWIEFEYPDKTVIKKTDSLFEYIDDKTGNKIVEHIGKYPKMPDRADIIETYSNGKLIKKWDEFSDVTEYYDDNGKIIKRCMPYAVETFDSDGRSSKEGGWADW